MLDYNRVCSATMARVMVSDFRFLGLSKSGQCRGMHVDPASDSLIYVPQERSCSIQPGFELSSSCIEVVDVLDIAWGTT